MGAAAIDGILPATAGLTFAVSLGLACETVRLDRGTARAVSVVLIVGSFILMGPLGVQSAVCVLLAGLVGAALYRARPADDEGPDGHAPSPPHPTSPPPSGRWSR